MVNEDAADLQTAEQKYIVHCNIVHCFLGNYNNYYDNVIVIIIDDFKRGCHQLKELCVSVPSRNIIQHLCHLPA